jgi:hypothetical protein
MTMLPTPAGAARLRRADLHRASCEQWPFVDLDLREGKIARVAEESESALQAPFTCLRRLRSMFERPRRGRINYVKRGRGCAQDGDLRARPVFF